MTKQSNKGAPAASKEAAENWDDAPAPGSQNPEPKQEPGPKPDPAPAEPTDKVSQDAAASTLKDAAANLPADPKSDEVAQRLRDIAEKLPKRPRPAGATDVTTIRELKQLLAGLPDDTKLYLADADTDWRVRWLGATLQDGKLLLSTGYSWIDGDCHDEFKAGT